MEMLKERLGRLAPFKYKKSLLVGVLRVLDSQLKGGTVKSYRTGLASYICFVQRSGIPQKEMFPASDVMLAAWSAEICRKVTYATYKNYFYGVKHYHVRTRMSVQGFESKFLKQMETGLRKLTRRRSGKDRWPITLPQLRTILGRLNGNSPRDALKGLIYTVGFYGGPRPSEYLKKYIGIDLCKETDGLVHPIVNVQDLSIKSMSRCKYMNIQTHGAKYDPEDKGYVMRFKKDWGDDDVANPVTWAEYHLRHRRKAKTAEPWMPLFALDGRNPTTVKWAKDALKSDAKLSGFCDKKYTGYSLRRGLATSLFLIGAPESVIKMCGRWKSEAYQRYIQVDRCTEYLWAEKLREATFKDFGALALEEAAEMKISEVSEFCMKFKKKIIIKRC